MLYALHTNWTELTHASIVYRFPVPQRYYVPHRLRQSYKRRLEGAGLWSLPGIEQDTKHLSKHRAPNEKVNPRDRFLKVFEREKVMNHFHSQPLSLNSSNGQGLGESSNHS